MITQVNFKTNNTIDGIFVMRITPGQNLGIVTSILYLESS